MILVGPRAGACVAIAQVRYTGAREKSQEERRERFVEDLKQGHSVIVSSRLLTIQWFLHDT